MTDFAEHSTAIRRLITEAEQCERGGMDTAALLELEDLLFHVKGAIAFIVNRKAAA